MSTHINKKKYPFSLRNACLRFFCASNNQPSYSCFFITITFNKFFRALNSVFCNLLDVTARSIWFFYGKHLRFFREQLLFYLFFSNFHHLKWFSSSSTSILRFSNPFTTGSISDHNKYSSSETIWISCRFILGR